MANITLKDVNGNNIYPEVDVSTLSGTITENNEKFVIGGDVYTALTGKANKSDIKPQKQANWYTTDETDPSYIYGKPTLYTSENYDDEHYRRDASKQPQYVYNCHEITSAEFTAKKFVVKLPLGKTNLASDITLMGDIYSIRGLTSLRGGDSIKVTSSDVESIEIALGDYDTICNNEPVIRHIDSSELEKSDRNVSCDSATQCRFHFTHFGSCTSSVSRINVNASYLYITVTLSSNTNLETGNIFQICASFVQFF